jgi:hypothetical protein
MGRGGKKSNKEPFFLNHKRRSSNCPFTKSEGTVTTALEHGLEGRIRALSEDMDGRVTAIHRALNDEKQLFFRQGTEERVKRPL